MSTSCFPKDGGLIIPVTLISNTANDGSEVVNVPAGTHHYSKGDGRSCQQRVFDVNNANITIVANPATFNLSLLPSQATV